MEQVWLRFAFGEGKISTERNPQTQLWPTQGILRDCARHNLLFTCCPTLPRGWTKRKTQAHCKMPRPSKHHDMVLNWHYSNLNGTCMGFSFPFVCHTGFPLHCWCCLWKLWTKVGTNTALTTFNTANPRTWAWGETCRFHGRQILFLQAVTVTWCATQVRTHR